MKLWLVASELWTTEFYVVRAADAVEARRLARLENRECTVVELPAEGDAALLWEYEYTPDSCPEGY